ncbi:MAG: protein kinase [Planctomycetota bacterium]
MNRISSTTTPDGCDAERLDQYLRGELGQAEGARLEAHLSQCDRCEQALRDRAAEASFWDEAATMLDDAGAGDSDVGSGAVDGNDIERILALVLDPTDDPSMLGRLEGYEVTGVIGRGGMGIVLKGFDRSLDRFVAIKVLDPSYAARSGARRRFAREAQAAAAVVHDNVIAIHGVHHDATYPSLVMPYVKGESLQQRIDDHAPLGTESVLEIGLQVARGLAAAHEQGLVHRDIKPANILLPASVSRVILTDFGLARAADDAALTQSGVIAGTPEYMSPEHVRGERMDGRSDLFSLGSVLYAMVTGHSPFRGSSSYAVMRRITDDHHRPAAQVVADVPSWLSAVIDRLLAKDPADRFASASELAEYLEDCLAHLRQPSTVELPRQPLAPARATLATMLTIVGLVAFTTAWLGRSFWETFAIERPVSVVPDLQIKNLFADPSLDRLETQLSELEEELNLPLVLREPSFKPESE